MHQLDLVSTDMLRPGDVCRYTGFDQSKLRYWRGKLRPLKNKAGNRRSYVPGELVALLVLDRLVTQIGCDIDKLASLAEAVFDACLGTHDWQQLEHHALVIQPTNKLAELHLAHSTAFSLDQDFTLIIALAPHIKALRGHLLNVQAAGSGSALPLSRARQRRFTRDQRSAKA